MNLVRLLNKLRSNKKWEIEYSVVFFSHWDGKELLGNVKKYLLQLTAKIKNRVNNQFSVPITRKEPNTVMVDFIRWFLKNEELVESNYYLGASEKDGDNGDNGHFVIDLHNNIEIIKEK